MGNTRLFFIIFILQLTVLVPYVCGEELLSEIYLSDIEKFQVYGQHLSQCEIHDSSKINQECEDLKFERLRPKKLTQVELHHKKVMSNLYETSSFSITFSKIKWQHMVFRVSMRTQEKQSYCGESWLSPGTEFHHDAVLSWCCPEYYEQYENEIVDLEYKVQTGMEQEIRHYMFKLPSLSSTYPNRTAPANWQLFLYLDVTEINVITVNWESPPKQFGVKSYFINVINNETGRSIDSANVSTHLNDEEILSSTFNMLQSGEFYFTVMPDNCYTNGCITRSPIVHIGTPSDIPMMAGIIFVTVAILLLIVGYMWSKAVLKWPETPPVVYIIYKRTSQPHVSVMVALTEYLRFSCHVDAKLDELDIPLSEAKNPFLWCLESFKKADAVMVVSSPPKVINHEAGIYQNIANIGLRLLAANYNDERKKLFSVVLPYCRKDDLPKESANLPYFVLLEDLDKMLWFIHIGCKPYWIRMLYILLGNRVPGGKSKLQSEGEMLLNALKNAAVDSPRKISSTNSLISSGSSGYESSIQNEHVDVLEEIKIAPSWAQEIKPLFENPASKDDELDIISSPCLISDLLSQLEYLNHENNNKMQSNMEEDELIKSQHFSLETSELQL